MVHGLQVRCSEEGCRSCTAAAGYGVRPIPQPLLRQDMDLNQNHGVVKGGTHRMDMLAGERSHSMSVQDDRRQINLPKKQGLFNSRNFHLTISDHIDHR